MLLEDADWETNIDSEVYLWEHCNKDAGLVSVFKEFEVDRDRFIEVYIETAKSRTASSALLSFRYRPIDLTVRMASKNFIVPYQDLRSI